MAYFVYSIHLIITSANKLIVKSTHLRLFLPFGTAFAEDGVLTMLYLKNGFEEVNDLTSSQNAGQTPADENLENGLLGMAE